MRVLGTRLPSSQTVHDRVFGGRAPGRPLAIPPRTLKLEGDKSEPAAYRLLWQKMKPQTMQAAEDLMGTYMPPGLAPSSLSYVNNKRRRGTS